MEAAHSKPSLDVCRDKMVLAIIIRGVQPNLTLKANIGKVAHSYLGLPEFDCIHNLDVQAFEKAVQTAERERDDQGFMSALDKLGRETQIEPLNHPYIARLLRQEPRVRPFIQRAFGVLALAWVMSVGFPAVAQLGGGECLASA